MQTPEHNTEHNLAVSMEMEVENPAADILQTQPEDQTTYSILEFMPEEVPKDYVNYIYAKWLRSAKYGNDIYKKIPSEYYYKSYSRYLDSLLHRCKVRLAVLDDDKDVLLGFACYKDKILHYVYVNREQRRQGIGKSLLPKEIEIYTHYTKDGIKIVDNKLSDLIFNPFIG